MFVVTKMILVSAPASDTFEPVMCLNQHTTVDHQVLEERLAKRRQVVEYKEAIDTEREEARKERISSLRSILSQKVLNGQLLERQNDELTDQYKFKLFNLYEELDKGNVGQKG